MSCAVNPVIGVTTMSGLEFTLNGSPVSLEDPDPQTTVLDWLRLSRGLTGTKEGCNEGDCGACTVLVSERRGPDINHMAVNSCIMFLPQLHGRSLRTIEGVCEADGSPNCVQAAMVDHHASQCGFCTPGIIMSLVAGRLNDDRRHDDVLAGNLCRCTGYSPIVRAADAACEKPLPEWSDTIAAAMPDAAGPAGAGGWRVAAEIGEFSEWYRDNPSATLVAGGTDVGLWVTKQLRDIRPICFIGGIPELRTIEERSGELRIGGCVTLAEFGECAADRFPSLAELMRRFGSVQIRNSGTIGGNVANGSPIGDASPALIALDARLELRCGGQRRTLPIEEFFVEYGRQDLRPGEFVETIVIPARCSRLKCYKLSKRFDQDISAVCGCFDIAIDDQRVASARIAFGGMAATPCRARRTEEALAGRPWCRDTVDAAMQAMRNDFAPISDMRASGQYRMQAARNMLLRYFFEDSCPDMPANILDPGN